MSDTTSAGPESVLDRWMVSPGQCLLCGGRGGYPGGPTGTMACARCAGTGRDPDRGAEWFMEHVLPVQIAAAAESHDLPPVRPETTADDLPGVPPW